MKHSKKQEKYWIIAAVLAIGAFVAWILFRGGKANEQKRLPVREANQFTTTMLSNTISDIVSQSKWKKYSSWIIAMAKHETGDFTSELCAKYNNLFGMGVPRKRTFLGTASPYMHQGQKMAQYTDPSNSVYDLLELFEFNNFPTNLNSVELFAKELKNDGYYTDSVDNYTAALKYWLGKNNWKVADSPKITIDNSSIVSQTGGRPIVGIGETGANSTTETNMFFDTLKNRSSC